MMVTPYKSLMHDHSKQQGHQDDVEQGAHLTEEQDGRKRQNVSR